MNTVEAQRLEPGDHVEDVVTHRELEVLQVEDTEVWCHVCGTLQHAVISQWRLRLVTHV